VDARDILARFMGRLMWPMISSRCMGAVSTHAAPAGAAFTISSGTSEPA
jgi:hypothetical protein